MSRPSKLQSLEEAMGHIKDGDRIMVGGFGLRGCPYELIDGLVETGKRELTIISNDLGSPSVGLGKLLRSGQVKALVGCYYNWNPEVAQACQEGKLPVRLVPMGTFVEAIRAAGVGIPAFYTPTSADTELGKGKPTREFGGRTCVLEEAIGADVALIQAHRADTLGNLTYCKTARNFNPLMAMAARYTVALAEQVVEPGELDPEAVVTPHVFVNAVVKGGGGI